MSMLTQDTNELMDTMFKVDPDYVMFKSNSSQSLNDYFSLNTSFERSNDETDINWIDSDYIDSFFFEDDKKLKNDNSIIPKTVNDSCDFVNNNKKCSKSTIPQTFIKKEKNKFFHEEYNKILPILEKYPRNMNTSSREVYNKQLNFEIDNNYKDATLPIKRKFHIRSTISNVKTSQATKNKKTPKKRSKLITLPKQDSPPVLDYYGPIDYDLRINYDNSSISNLDCIMKKNQSFESLILSNTMDGKTNISIYNSNENMAPKVKKANQSSPHINDLQRKCTNNVKSKHLNDNQNSSENISNTICIKSIEAFQIKGHYKKAKI